MRALKFELCTELGHVRVGLAPGGSGPRRPVVYEGKWSAKRHVKALLASLMHDDGLALRDAYTEEGLAELLLEGPISGLVRVVE
jgi:hypothetical protein